MIIKTILLLICIIVGMTMIFAKILAIIKLGFGDYTSKKEFWNDFFIFYTAFKNYKDL